MSQARGIDGRSPTRPGRPAALARRRPAHATGLREPDAAERRGARLALAGVALCYLLLHALLAGLDRPVNWDETVHLTQVVPGRAAAFFEPHRTRGLALLVAPVGVFDPSMTLLRAYLAVLGAGGIFLAFGTWIKSVGYAAPLAAMLFSSFWVTLFYGVEVLPNLPTALLTVALGGLAVQVIEARHASARRCWMAGTTMFALAMVRPPDAVLVGFAITVVVLVLAPPAARRLVPSLAAGGAAGLLPWFVEGAVRFGFNPIELLRSGGDYSTNIERLNRFPIYVRFLEERLRCGAGCERELLQEGSLWALPGTRTTLFIAGCLALVLVTAVFGGRRRRPALVAAVTVVPLLAFYSITSTVNLRYVLPVIALWLLVPAVGAVALWRFAARVRGGVGLQALAALLVLWAVWWQASSGVDRLHRMVPRERAQQLGEELAAVADGEPCAVATRVSRPIIQYWSGCLAVGLVTDHSSAIQAPLGELDSYVDLSRLARVGYRVFAIAAEDQAPDSPVVSWASRDFTGDLTEGFTLYEHRPGDALPPPPCPPPEGPARMLAEVLSPDC